MRKKEIVQSPENSRKQLQGQDVCGDAAGHSSDSSKALIALAINGPEPYQSKQSRPNQWLLPFCLCKHLPPKICPGFHMTLSIFFTSHGGIRWMDFSLHGASKRDHPLTSKANVVAYIYFRLHFEQPLAAVSHKLLLHVLMTKLQGFA